MQKLKKRLKRYIALLLCISILSCTFVNDVMASFEIPATASDAEEFYSVVYNPDILARSYYENGRYVENAAYPEIQPMFVTALASELVYWVFLVVCSSLGLYSSDKTKIRALADQFMETVVPNYSFLDPDGLIPGDSIGERFKSAMEMSVVAGVFSFYQFRQLTGIDLIGDIKSFVKANWETQLAPTYTNVVPMTANYVFNQIPDSLLQEAYDVLGVDSKKNKYIADVKDYIDQGYPYVLSVMYDKGMPLGFSLFLSMDTAVGFGMTLTEYGPKKWSGYSTQYFKFVLSHYQKVGYVFQSRFRPGEENDIKVERSTVLQSTPGSIKSGVAVSSHIINVSTVSLGSLVIYDIPELSYTYDIFCNCYDMANSVAFSDSLLKNTTLHFFTNTDSVFKPDFTREVPTQFHVGVYDTGAEAISSAMAVSDRNITAEEINALVQAAFQTYVDGLSGQISDNNSNIKDMASSITGLLSFLKDTTAAGFIAMLVAALASAFQISTIVAKLTDVASAVAGWSIDNWDQVLRAALASIHIGALDDLVNLVNTISRWNIDAWDSTLEDVLARVNIKGLDSINTALTNLGNWTFADWKDVFNLAITVPILAALATLRADIASGTSSALTALGLDGVSLGKTITDALSGLGMDIDLDKVKDMLMGLGLGALAGYLSSLLDLVGSKGLAGVLAQVVELIKALPISIAASVAEVFPGGRSEKEDSGNLSIKNFFNLLLFLGLILIMLLILFINCLRFIVVVFNIPACTEFLNADIIRGMDFIKAVQIPGLGLSLYDLLFGAVYIVLFFSIIKALRKRIDHLKIR